MSYLDCCCKKKPGSYTHGSRHVVSRRYSAGWNTWASNPRYRREITGIQWELYGNFYESIVDGVGLQWEFAHVYTTYHHMVMQIYGEIYIYRIIEHDQRDRFLSQWNTAEGRLTAFFNIRQVQEEGVYPRSASSVIVLPHANCCMGH